MKNRLFFYLVLIVATVAFAALGCSDDKGSNNNNGGNTREFASGDLANGASFTHTFNTARVINYYCRYHGAAGLQGMSGTITVTATGTVVQFNFSITGSTLPSMTIPVGSTVRWTNNTGLVHTVESDN